VQSCASRRRARPYLNQRATSRGVRFHRSHDRAYLGRRQSIGSRNPSALAPRAPFRAQSSSCDSRPIQRGYRHCLERSSRQGFARRSPCPGASPSLENTLLIAYEPWAILHEGRPFAGDAPSSSMCASRSEGGLRPVRR
jgi:hypothetical protein